MSADNSTATVSASLTEAQRFELARQEIADVLAKYNMTIDAGCCDSSDLHGVQDQHMAFSCRRTGKTVRVGNDWELTAEELREPCVRHSW